jgi:cell division initiation protein
MLRVGRYLSPVEVKEQRFEQKFRGYDVKAVDEFMLHLSADYEALYRERQELAEQVDRLQEELARYKKLEDNVQEAIVTAQQAAKQVTENAKREGELIIERARFEAAQEKAKLQKEVAEAAEKLAALNNQAIAFRAQMSSLLRGFQELLESNLPAEGFAFLQAAAAKEEEDDRSGGDSSVQEEGSPEGERGSGTVRQPDPGQDGDSQPTARFSADRFNSPGEAR